MRPKSTKGAFFGDGGWGEFLLACSKNMREAKVAKVW